MRAALDVFENEPSVHSKLRSNPHVVSDSDGNNDAVWGALFGVRG
jgi:lactate dehydrogenase-like 2-hydroxyacid dehydrogenase